MRRALPPAWALFSLAFALVAQAQEALPLEGAKVVEEPRRASLSQLGEMARRALPAPRFGLELVGDEDPQGLLIKSVRAGTPAALAGLKAGDRLLSVALGGRRVSAQSRKRLEDLRSAASQGDDFELEVKRGGERLTLSGRLGSRPFKLMARKTGRFHLAVVLVEFSDQKHNPAFKLEDFSKALFSRGLYTDRSPSGEPVFGSMADYYHEVSCGQFELSGEIHDWLQLPLSKAEVGTFKPDPLSGQRKFLNKALDLLRARDGEHVLARADGIAFVIAGGTGPHGSVLWPHSAILPDLRGRKLWDYYVMEEGGQRFAGIGVHCHEFGHVLGLLDMYGVHGYAGLGCFCLMAVGHRGAAFKQIPLDAPELDRKKVAQEYLEKSLSDARKQLEKLFRPRAPEPADRRPALVDRRPLHFCAPSKERLGWIEPVVIDPRVPQRLSLPPIEGHSKHAALKILLNAAGTESYLLEYRTRTGFDAGFPRSGLLIWHIGDIEGPIKTFIPFYFLDLEKAHGSTSLDSAYRAPDQIPFGPNTQDRFTPFTRPSSQGSQPGAWPVWITDIREKDGRLELSIGMPDALKAPAAPR